VPDATRLSPELDFPLGDVEKVLHTAGTAMVVDLEPCLGVRLAAEIYRRGLAHVVLVLPRWPHAEAVLPTNDLLATLLATSRGLAPAEGATRNNVVFVLDGERQRRIRRPANDVRVDNRYPLLAADLPPLRVLRTAGIQRVVKLTRSRA